MKSLPQLHLHLQQAAHTSSMKLLSDALWFFSFMEAAVKCEL